MGPADQRRLAHRGGEQRGQLVPLPTGGQQGEQYINAMASMHACTIDNRPGDRSHNATLPPSHPYPPKTHTTNKQIGADPRARLQGPRALLTQVRLLPRRAAPRHHLGRQDGAALARWGAVGLRAGIVLNCLFFSISVFCCFLFGCLRMPIKSQQMVPPDPKNQPGGDGMDGGDGPIDLIYCACVG